MWAWAWARHRRFGLERRAAGRCLGPGHEKAAAVRRRAPPRVGEAAWPEPPVAVAVADEQRPRCSARGELGPMAGGCGHSAGVARVGPPTARGQWGLGWRWLGRRFDGAGAAPRVRGPRPWRGPQGGSPGAAPQAWPSSARRRLGWTLSFADGRGRSTHPGQPGLEPAGGYRRRAASGLVLARWAASPILGRRWGRARPWLSARAPVACRCPPRLTQARAGGVGPLAAS